MSLMMTTLDSERRAVTQRVRHRVRVSLLRQETVAAALGINRTSLSNRLTGRTPWRAHELMALATLLDTTVDDLLEGSDDE